MTFLKYTIIITIRKFCKINQLRNYFRLKSHQNTKKWFQKLMSICTRKTLEKLNKNQHTSTSYVCLTGFVNSTCYCSNSQLLPFKFFRINKNFCRDFLLSKCIFGHPIWIYFLWLLLYLLINNSIRNMSSSNISKSRIINKNNFD